MTSLKTLKLLLCALVLTLTACGSAPPMVTNSPGCVACGGEEGNSGAGTYYAGGKVLWQRP